MALRDSRKCIIKKKLEGIWPRLGDVILVHNGGPRCLRKQGKITGLHTGRDRNPKIVEVGTVKGTVTYPVIKLYSLEQDLEIELTRFYLTCRPIRGDSL